MLSPPPPGGPPRRSGGNDSSSRGHADGRIKQRSVESVQALLELLSQDFRLDLGSDAEPLRQRLQALLKT